MQFDTTAMMVIVSGLATLITALVTFRQSESSSKLEERRTALEEKRFGMQYHYDQAMQGAQVVNSMASSLLEQTAGQLREALQENNQLEDRVAILDRANTEMQMTLRAINRLVCGLEKALELELPNGTRDRLERLMDMCEDMKNRGVI